MASITSKANPSSKKPIGSTTARGSDALRRQTPPRPHNLCRARPRVGKAGVRIRRDPLRRPGLRHRRRARHRQIAARARIRRADRQGARAGPWGSCTTDGQQTPFRAFIEIVRGAYRLAPGHSEAVVAERRQVTVLFTDMVVFTTFSERSGEEAAFTLMQSLAKPMEDAVRAQRRPVQGFTGDASTRILR